MIFTTAAANVHQQFISATLNAKGFTKMVCMPRDGFEFLFEKSISLGTRTLSRILKWNILWRDVLQASCAELSKYGIYIYGFEL